MAWSGTRGTHEALAQKAFYLLHLTIFFLSVMMSIDFTAFLAFLCSRNCFMEKKTTSNSVDAD